MLATGALLVLLSATLAAYLLVAPAARVPVERRLSPGAVPTSPLENVVERMEVAVDWVLRKRGWNPFPGHDLEMAGIRMQQSSFVTAVLMSTFAAFMVGYAIGGVLIGLLIAVLVPLASRAIVSSRRRKRQNAFADQLESTLEVIASALRAGHSLPSALDTVSADALSPTAEEFARIVNEGRLGLDTVEAMRETARRMRSEDFGWITDAVAIQRDTGGNLSEVLDRVGETIRERNALAQQVRAISAEGRASSKVMMAMPLAVGVFMFWRSPSTFTPIFTTGVGQLLLGIAVVLYVIGFFWIRRLVEVKV
ncbi:type II secretion system F family protein [Aeromicrobium endophyticum]|uniref:Type II secretion system protein F n=1 Tax=Aeromicrobium endophyticum TaxID=2292704 RepID=A0A371PD69_9ACTN|nr:type II secretion system F family protein [Aeromicrobium endophyticum]REK73903.1 type II secretion system protein F [Aeromicrobium endophyticum]